MHSNLCTKERPPYPHKEVFRLAKRAAGCDHLPNMRLAISGIGRWRILTLLAAAVVCTGAPGLSASAQQQAPRTTLVTRSADALTGAVDAGPVPSSQRLALTLTLAPSDAQTAALDQFLTDVQTSSSPSFRKWLTPRQFAASYGPAPDRVAAATAWLQAQGLSVDAVSPSGMRLSVSGFAAQAQAAFAVSLHTYQIKGALAFANTEQPSLPAEAADYFQSIEGLDNLGGSSAPIAALAALVDGNASPVLTVDAAQSAGTISASRIAAYSALFRQAAAQGITPIVLPASGVPTTLPEVTALVLPGATADTSTPVAARPAWQNAPGLPADGLRHAPDLTVPSLAAFQQALATIAAKVGGRLGNINPVLYELAPVAGLYTQPDNAAAGTWEAATGLGLIDTAAFVKAYPYGTGTNNLQIQSSVGSPTHGQSFTLTATVVSTNGGSVPTGTITFSAPQSGFTSTSVTVNGSGIAQWTSNLLPGGMYTVTATYSGDGNYAPGTASITLTVQPEAANFTLSAPSSTTLGASFTATAAATSSSGVGSPNVNITVTPSGITGATATTQTISGGASAQFTYTAIQAGSVNLQASCSPNDQSFTCYTPQSASITVSQATPTVALTISPAKPTAGQQVSFAATVTGVTGISPTGSVQFFDGTTSIGFGGAPSATYTGTLSAGASHSLSAVYLGDSNYLKATSSVIPTAVGTAPTATVVSASATSAPYGQSVTLNITVSGSTVVNGTQPTGTLTFTGAGSTTTSAISGGSASVTLNNLAVGTYTIGTTYSGDTNYAGSTGNTVTVNVTQSTASLNPSISTTSFTNGSTATLTVTVTLPGNAQLPSGSTFIATIVGITGASYTGTFAINSGGNTGTGAVTIPAPIAGSYTLQITCGTSANFTCTPASLAISSTATTGTTGTSTGTTLTTTTLAISPITPTAGQAVTFTATVSASANAIAANPLAGTVNFYDGTTLIGSATVGAGGIATASISLTAGTSAQSLTAQYQGNTVYAGSTSNAVPVTIAASAAVVTLTSNVTSTLAGTSVVLTATVTGSTSTGIAPTGTVSFYLGGATPALVGTASVGSIGNGIGTAVFSTSNLPAGALTLYAVYKGDSNFSSATSNSITLGLSDYSVSFVPQTLTLTQGSSGTATAVVSLIDNFPGTVIFGCTPPPNYEITCSFSPATVTGGGSTTLTVNTTRAKSQSVDSGERASLGATGGVTLAALCCLLLPTGRRRLPALLLLLLALGLTMNLGCSANNFNPIAAANAGTPYGTTLLTIDTAGATGGVTVRHDYTFQVTIQ